MIATPTQEKYRDPNPVVCYVLRRFFDRIRAALAEVQPASILDAGCGEGELFRRNVLPEAVPVTSLDLSLAALQAVGPALLGCRRPLGRRFCASIQALPFQDASFDAVLTLEVLEHLPDPAAALQELKRVARKAVILSVPHEPYFRIGNVLRGKHLSRWGDHPEHIQHWNPATFGDFLQPHFRRVQLIDAFPWIVASCRVDPHA